ncbi:Plasma membrane low glucose sensor, variant 2 [Orbilia oligospora]|uniref:Plasma membrane low glucose sensor n=1 Tax=Orbilia oligospora TaxID=2813651 RepID=A0A7C8J9S9_ORBOL|nr:Plasma membrane low glucose sensor [Orbilia oligospora]KAF3098907.1 Plasma membrane low glucose sensor [Orbilia oligospora]KAF3108174.1 Plasma membrane low glucose sensor [Orbilia oligospora]KAF3124553.1 Plasma membrane low glucose sensor [Orbilia oligospora]KAF3133313.1 Plasma membrane low glucose sensor [Orbilia oligospora]
MWWISFQEGSVIPGIIVGCFVAIGGLIFGWDTGNINGILAMDSFIRDYATNVDAHGRPYITAGQSSLIVSILSAGTVIGSLTANFWADWIGRRWGLILSSTLFTVGVILQTLSTALPLFIIGRMITGIGVGLISVMVPLYQAESAPRWIRGSIIGCYQLSITIGLLLTTIISNATHSRTDTGAYRIPISLQAILSVTLAVGMLFLPESPRFLVKRGHPEAATLALAKLRALPRDHPTLQEELEEIELFHEIECDLGKATWKDCFRGNLGARLWTGCGLQALQQLTGINFIFYYGTTYFKTNGVSRPFVISLIANIVNVVATIPGLYLVEKAGRAPLLFIGALGMGFCQLVIAVVGLTTSTDVANKVLIGLTCVYIAFFAMTWGLGGWIVTGEIFPLRVRAKSMSMTAATNWIVNWALSYSTPYLVDESPDSARLGSKICFIWAGFCFLSVWFVQKYIHETKGISLEQVDGVYHGSTAAKIRNRLSSVTGASLRKRDTTHVNEIIPLHVAAAGGMPSSYTSRAPLSPLSPVHSIIPSSSRDSNEVSPGSLERGSSLPDKENSIQRVDTSGS